MRAAALVLALSLFPSVSPLIAQELTAVAVPVYWTSGRLQSGRGPGLEVVPGAALGGAVAGAGVVLLIEGLSYAGPALTRVLAKVGERSRILARRLVLPRPSAPVSVSLAALITGSSRTTCTHVVSSEVSLV